MNSNPSKFNNLNALLTMDSICISPRKVFEDWKHTIKEMNISKLSINNETKGN